MPARSIQIAAVTALVAVIVVVLAVTQFSSGSDDVTPTPSATALPSPSASASASPTDTPEPSDTPTPSPTPSPTPEAPDAAFRAITNLVNETGASPSDFTVLSYEQATWPAADYGCPAPGKVYAQVEVSGWAFEIGYQDEVIEFHVDIDDVTGEDLINCTENRRLLEDAINPVELAGLRATTAIEMRRRNSETGVYDLWSTVTEQDDIDAILATLDVPVLLSEASACTPVFRLVFVTPDGDETFDAICGGNSQLFRGAQGFWEGMQGAVPREFGTVIGPYYSDVPLPVPPTAAPTATTP